MSLIQKVFKSVLPRAKAEAMEAESRRWLAECGNCGHARSLWDLGGIRWKATGKPRTYLKCPQCGKRAWHKIFKV